MPKYQFVHNFDGAEGYWPTNPFTRLLTPNCGRRTRQPLFSTVDVCRAHNDTIEMTILAGADKAIINTYPFLCTSLSTVGILSIYLVYCFSTTFYDDINIFSITVSIKPWFVPSRYRMAEMPLGTWCVYHSSATFVFSKMLS